MNWEAIAAIATLFAIALTIFLDWPKFISRIKSIPFYVYYILLFLFFLVASIFSAVMIILMINSSFNPDNITNLLLSVGANILSNIGLGVLLVVALPTNEINEKQTYIIFVIWGLAVYVQMFFSFLFLYFSKN